MDVVLAHRQVLIWRTRWRGVDRSETLVPVTNETGTSEFGTVRRIHLAVEQVLAKQYFGLS